MLEVELTKKLKEFTMEISFQDGLEGRDGCLGVLGASGCGKSMMLKMSAGIEMPDAGRIVLGGRILFDSEKKICLKPQKRKVGYLFQNYALFPNMTVAENVAAGLTGPKAFREERVGEMLERFHLKELAARYPDALSGGQQQRAALARILAYEPDAILLDEPFSALDGYLKEELQLELLELLSGYRGSVVLVTHDRDEVYRLTKNLMILDRGRLVEKGGTGQLFQNPAHYLSARLTGCKNLSRAGKLSRYRLAALDWGIELVTCEPVPDDLSFVGVRAHDFLPASGPDQNKGAAENVMPVRVLTLTESPFEWVVVFKNAGSGEGEKKPLWWKFEKDIRHHDLAGQMPQYLRIPPECLLLLRGQ